MSDNNSFGDNNPNGDLSLSMQYALRVALQTMKERCISLQQRLTVVEEENLVLRNRLAQNPANDNFPDGSRSELTEIENLREKMEELARQKVQLTDHIAMVATENRQLWSRLSQLAKERNKQRLESKVNSENSSSQSNSGSSNAGQNLIRSKTFTQHSPNPNLRHVIPNADENDMSLEEVVLDFVENKESPSDEKIFNACGNSLAFSYLNDSDGDLNQEARKCIDGEQDIKKELLKQQSDIKVALSSLKNKLVFQECADCKRKSQKPETADKSLETDESLVETRPPQLAQQSSAEKPQKEQVKDTSNTDFYEQTQFVDSNVDKMCPLCGRVYTNSTSFDAFREHVEMHFIDDSELDPSLDRNFEFISHVVGDF